MGNNLCPIYDYGSIASDNDYPGSDTCSPCQIDPCQNGGSCVNVNGFFQCKCPANFNGIFCNQTANGPLLSMTAQISSKRHSGTTGRIWVEVIGSLGNSGPYFLGFGMGPGQTLSLVDLQLESDVGSIWGLKIITSYFPDGLRINRIDISSPQPLTLGRQFVRGEAILAGRRLFFFFLLTSFHSLSYDFLVPHFSSFERHSCHFQRCGCRQ